MFIVNKEFTIRERYSPYSKVVYELRGSVFKKWVWYLNKLWGSINQKVRINHTHILKSSLPLDVCTAPCNVAGDVDHAGR